MRGVDCREAGVITKPKQTPRYTARWDELPVACAMSQHAKAQPLKAGLFITLLSLLPS